MRRLLLAAVMFGAVSSAPAADLPDFLRGSYSPAPATRNWDGWYAGGQVGYSSTNMDFGQSLAGLTNFIFRSSVLEEPTSQLTALGKAHSQGTGFGAFVGRNYQWDDVVLGVEANYDIHNLTGSSASSIGPLQFSFPAGQLTPQNDTPTFGVTLKGSAAAQIKDAITFRSRAGWATGNFLPYMFGGLAVGRIDVQRTVTSTTTRRDDITTTDPISGITSTVIGQTFLVPSQSTTQSQGRTNNFVVGWTGGLGMEYVLWNNVFLRGEWEYVKFLSVENTAITLNSVRAGIGYKF